MEKRKVIGIDYGTDSARAILVDASNGNILSSASMVYPRWSKGKYCDSSASSFRQHPKDYEEVLHFILNKVLEGCSCREDIAAIGIDTTASTPALSDSDGIPLAALPEFEDDPDAMFVLWKDHTGIKEAEEITASGNSSGYCARSAGNYSAENFWSKVLHLVRTSPETASRADSVIELCDYIPSLLIGKRAPVSRCCASYKAMWAKEWNGLPPRDFFLKLGGEKAASLRDSYPEMTSSSSSAAGTLSPAWAKELGLSEDVIVSVGNIDAHSGAVGAGCAVGTPVLNMGTSACLMAVMPAEEYKGRIIDGVFGQVSDGIIEGMEGFESGMSSFGDNFAWLRNLLADAMKMLLQDNVDNHILEKAEERILNRLGEEASRLKTDKKSPFATDWFNGRRSPAPDPQKKATIGNLGIHTGAAEIFYAIAEANAFGVKAMIDTLVKGGVRIDKINAVGGIALKSPFMVQMIADVTGKEIFVPDSPEACGLGAAINAAVAASLYDNVITAQDFMCTKKGKTYLPDSSKDFSERYARYLNMY